MIAGTVRAAGHDGRGAKGAAFVMQQRRVHPASVVVTTLNWNGFDDTEKFLQSAGRLEYPDFKTILVDNGSRDGSGERREVHHIWPAGDFASASIDVDAVSGSSMMVRADALGKVGFLDPSYFLYYEETDWCVRFRQAGMRVVLATRAKVWHRVGGAVSTPVFFYMRFRNKAAFVTRHARWLQIVMFFPYHLAEAFARIFYYWLCGRRADLVAVWLVVADYVRGNMGRGSYDRVSRLTQ